MDLTINNIKKLKPLIKTKRTTIKSLSIVVEQRHDVIIFLFKYVSPFTFKKRFMKIGLCNYGKVTPDLLDALRKKALKLNNDVISGIDPLHEVQVKRQEVKQKTGRAHTYPALWNLYINTDKYKKLGDKSQIVYEIKFRKLQAHFGYRDINTITQFERDIFLESSSATVSNGIFTIIKHLEAIYRKTNVTREQKLDSIERSTEYEYAKVPQRNKVLSDEEIRLLFKSESTFALILQWQLMHGCRISEVIGMRWQEFDFRDRTWTIPSDRIKTEKKGDVIRAILLCKADFFGRGLLRSNRPKL